MAGKIQSTVLLAALAVAVALPAAAGRATPQTRAEKVNECIRKNLKGVDGSSHLWNPGYTKVFALKYLFGKDAEFVDYANRRLCLRSSFIAAVHDHDAPFAACVLVRIRREVKGFSPEDEESLAGTAIANAGFATDYAKSLFRHTLREEIAKASSPAGHTLARLRTIRIEPFILRPPATLADALNCLNARSVASDYVNGGMGVKFVIKADSFGGAPPKLPKLQVGDYEYGNTGVTLEEAVKTIAESAGYAFNVRPDGVVALARKRKCAAK